MITSFVIALSVEVITPKLPTTSVSRPPRCEQQQVHSCKNTEKPQARGTGR